MVINRDKFSTDVQRSIVNDHTLSEEYGIVGEIADKLGLTVAIAGGAVRDTLLGLRYRDIDFFIPNMASDEVDDTLVYLTELYREKKPFHTRPATLVGPHNYPSENAGFVGYEFPSRANFREGVHTPTVQFIARPKSTLEEIIDSFDYDLVRCWYDGKYHIDERFEAVIKGKRVPTTDGRTYDRVQRWKDRTGFKITVGRPPKNKKDPVRTITLTLNRPIDNF